MHKKIKIQTPAKINLSLEILDRLPSGFHSISSVMQTVSVYDYLTISKTEISGENKIILRGNSPDIPYDEKNIIYKVIKSYFDKLQIRGVKVEVDIEKNIPTQAGLAGGSTNAAGALIGINALFDESLSKEDIHQLAAQAGSDLNFCLEGGACLLSSRGEVIDEKLPFQDFKVVIVKPKNISVSTPLCYKNFSAKYFVKKEPSYSKKICEIFKSSSFSQNKLAEFLYNDLEKPAIDAHPELLTIKNNIIKAGAINALMSGSGSSIFGILDKDIEIQKNDNFVIFYANSVKNGVKIA